MLSFLLAGHAEGLDTLCIGMFDAVASGRGVIVPKGATVVVLSLLEYAVAEAKVPPRKDSSEFVHWNRYTTG